MVTLVTTAGAWGASPENARPNVVLILADDLGYGNLGCYGAEPPVGTPNIDRLAHTGVRFTDAYVTASLCFPSRVALLTGRYPSRFGIYATNAAWYHGGLPRDEMLISEPLQHAGYATVIIGKWHLGSGEGKNPLDRGFNYYFGYDHCCEDYFAPEHLLRNRSKVEKADYLTEAFTDEAVAFIRQHRDGPFFLYLPYNAVHGPVQAPERYREMFDTGNRTDDTFFGMLKCLDDGVGRVMQALRDCGQYENTLVFFLSDNGGTRGMPGPNNAPLRGFKRTLWEGGLRIPFIVSWPGQLPAGHVYRQPAISLDVFATVLAATRTPLPQGHSLDGKNLLPALQGERKEPLHDMLAWAGTQHDREHNPHYDEPAGHAKARAVWAVRCGEWKLINPGSGPRLYNLQKDPGESHNVLDEHPETADRLRKAYCGWFDQMDPPLHWEAEFWKGRLAPSCVGEPADQPAIDSACADTGPCHRVSNSGSGPFAGRDGAPIRQALERLPETGGTVLIEPGVYVIRKPIRPPSHATIRGVDPAKTVLRLPAPTRVTTPAARGDRSIAVADTTSFEPDTVVELLPPQGDRFEVLESHSLLLTIQAVETDRLRFAEPLPVDLPAQSRVGYAHHLFDIRRPLKDITIENLTLQGSRIPEIAMPGHAERCAIWAVSPYTYADGPRQPPVRQLAIKNCTIEDFYGRAVAMYNVVDSVVLGCRISHIDDEAIDFDHFVQRCRAEENVVHDAHVGVTLNDASHCVARHNQLSHCGSGIRLWWWHLVDPEGVNEHNTIEHNAILAPRGAAIFLSQHAENNTVRYNCVDGPIDVAEPDQNTVFCNTGARAERND